MNCLPKREVCTGCGGTGTAIMQMQRGGQDLCESCHGTGDVWTCRNCGALSEFVIGLQERSFALAPDIVTTVYQVGECTGSQTATEWHGMPIYAETPHGPFRCTP